MNKSIDKTQEALRVERALKLALEALEGVATWVEVRPKTHPWDTWQRVEPAIAALREALAHAPTEREQPAQPSKPWVGLTDEQIQAIAFEAVKDNWDWLKFARAIEAKLKEKNQ